MATTRRPPPLDDPEERERLIRQSVRQARGLQALLLGALWLAVVVGAVFALGAALTP